MRRSDAGADWTVGRAGMLYKDLVPDRDGGRILASRIRIPEGGPVGDWVHFHRVAFQVIFVLEGRVELVYEDQGPSFFAGPGDCVLQPPTIRHRVLHTDAGLEVLELASPAEHATEADSALELPTDHVDRERLFGGQRFHLARDTPECWERRGLVACRDLGVEGPTGGVAAMREWRAVEAVELAVEKAEGALHFLYVREGAIGVAEAEDQGRVVAGGAVVLDGSALVAVERGARWVEVLLG